MMNLKKSAIGMFVLAFTSLILITGSPFQIANNLVENNGLLPIKYIGEEDYADDDDEYEYVHCGNGIWYPENTDCKVALKQYREEWGIADDEEEESNQEDNKLLVPDEFKGTLTKKQKEALTKENPNWEFDKSYELIPNSLEGTETPEQLEVLGKAGIEWEYEWEDTASNPVPGTPSYVGPEEEEKKYVNPDGGAPLYEDELREEEKDDYTEYNDADESNDVEEEEEESDDDESDDDESEDDEQEEDEPEEGNSDSES